MKQPNGGDDARKIAMSIMQGPTGDCMVIEHDLIRDESKTVAIFQAEKRVVTVAGKWGPELANRDCAQIRAMIFVQLFEKLVNEGKVDLG